MYWKLYRVEKKSDKKSQVGYTEILTEVPLNETEASYDTPLLSFPPLSMDYDLYKAVFRIEVSIINNQSINQMIDKSSDISTKESINLLISD